MIHSVISNRETSRIRPSLDAQLEGESSTAIQSLSLKDAKRPKNMVSKSVG